MNRGQGRLIVIGLLALLMALGLAACGDDNATTAPATLPPGTVGATVLAGPTKARAEHFPVVVPTPPKGFTPPEKRPCPDGWGQISDDMAVYSICVPPGWGIPDPDSSAPVANVVLHYGNPEIFSPEAFPWLEEGEREIGQKLSNPDADFVRVTLFPITPDTTVSDTCEANRGITVAGLPATGCEYRYDREVGRRVPNPLGSWCGRQIFVSLPLARPPGGPSETPVPNSTYTPFSAVLGIVVLGRCEVVERYQDTLSEMLDSLQVVP